MSEQALHVGMRVAILAPELTALTEKTGTIYDHCPDRWFPWMVRPDDWPDTIAGIAFQAEELEPIEEDQKGVSHG